MAKVKLKWHNDTAKLGKLIPCDYNPRYMDDEDRELLSDSIDEFDLVEVPIINSNNEIIAGHQRIIDLMSKHGEDYEIDIRKPNRKLTKKEYDKYLVVSNSNSGKWDFDLLSENFDIDDCIDWGIDENGFDITKEKLDPESFDDGINKINVKSFITQLNSDIARIVKDRGDSTGVNELGARASVEKYIIDHVKDLHWSDIEESTSN